jgi:hypothetical protein
MRQALVAADLLDRFVRVGFPPDILDCAIAVRDVLGITDVAHSMGLIHPSSAEVGPERAYGVADLNSNQAPD